jgi:hypothetical protein
MFRVLSLLAIMAALFVAILAAAPVGAFEVLPDKNRRGNLRNPL